MGVGTCSCPKHTPAVPHTLRNKKCIREQRTDAWSTRLCRLHPPRPSAQMVKQRAGMDGGSHILHIYTSKHRRDVRQHNIKIKRLENISEDRPASTGSSSSKTRQRRPPLLPRAARACVRDIICAGSPCQCGPSTFLQKSFLHLMSDHSPPRKYIQSEVRVPSRSAATYEKRLVFFPTPCGL